MSVNASETRERWRSIRSKKECDLALTAESVAKNLETPEYHLVQQRILETLNQLASYRANNKSFHNTKPAGTGDLVTCEGLEAFLVPAVEGALEFSLFLAGFRGSSLEDRDRERREFVDGFVADVEVLLDHWARGQFSGQPYADENKILQSLPPATRERLKRRVNITEAAAMACRVLIHLLTLKLNPSADERKFGYFRLEIGNKLNDERMFAALGKAIEFLVQSFQKGEGATEEERIGNARVGPDEGSGWSWTWTDRERLPPMLFFTASAVDAFAELDLYLIRQAEQQVPASDGRIETLRPWEASGTDDQKRLLAFYDAHKTSLELYQFCVEMARRWVQSTALLSISQELGQYNEVDAEYYIGEKKRYDEEYGVEVLREGLKYPPMVCYNSLYGLQILLWSWADWDNYGTAPNEDAKNKFNRALAQLVYNYDRIPVVKQVLNDFPNQFYLPGRGFFAADAEKQCTYLDAGFLPLLTRLLVLFVVYGVGDRNLLEPVIRDLYVELLQNRNRTNLSYSALWADREVEIFSTQRAIQALTFYFAYARGKELVTRRAIPEAPRETADLIVMRNKTGRRLFLEAVFEDSVAPEPPAPTVPVKSPEPVIEPHIPFPARTFGDYCNKERGLPLNSDYMKFLPEEQDFSMRVNALGNDIIKAIESRDILDVGAARLILNSLAPMMLQPSINNVIREPELRLLEEQYKDLKLSKASSSAAG
jgi:hypothetical protein